MSVDLGRNRLFREFETLRVRWEQTQRTWQDSVRNDFIDAHWKPLEALVITTLAAMDRVAPIIPRVRQECGDQERL